MNDELEMLMRFEVSQYPNALKVVGYERADLIDQYNMVHNYKSMPGEDVDGDISDEQCKEIMSGQR